MQREANQTGANFPGIADFHLIFAMKLGILFPRLYPLIRERASILLPGCRKPPLKQKRAKLLCSIAALVASLAVLRLMFPSQSPLPKSDEYFRIWQEQASCPSYISSMRPWEAGSVQNATLTYIIYDVCHYASCKCSRNRP